MSLFRAVRLRPSFDFVVTKLLVAGFLLPCLALLLSGCGMATNSPVSGNPAHSVALQGSMYGGQQPVSGALLQLYAVGTTGDGSPATPLISATLTTSDGSGNATNANANAGNAFNSLPAGSFTITGTYTCPVPDQQVYLVGTGGNPGLGVNKVNPVLAMMTVLGPCSQLQPTTFVQINELTSIASLAPIAPYMNGYASLGSGPGDAAAFQAALNLVRSYTDTTHGTVPGPDLAPGYYASSTEITTLADILAGCINSDGTGVCQQLFTLATPPGGVAPTDTIGAAVDILKNPTHNAAAIFDLLAPGAPFQPVLSTPPAAWALPILPNAATPSISPASGSYALAPSISISDATPGATIYYTTDNTTPTTASSVYTASFSFNASAEPTRIVRAFAVAPGFGPSAVAVNTYTLPAGGTGSALAFLTQPVDSVVNTNLPGVRVGIVDAYGKLVADHFKGITLSLAANPGGATLGGTVIGGTSTGDGSFTFTGLSLNKVADGYTLQATSGGYASAVSTFFNITPTPIVFTTPGALIGEGVTATGTFTLPTAAPAGGVTVSLSSSNTAAITVSPASVTLNSGDTKGTFTYTAVGSGATTLRASAPSYTDGTITETTTANFITLGALPTAPGAAQTLPVTLSQPAPAGGLSVALTSSATAIATVTATATFPAGATTPSNLVNIQAKGYGTSTITATAAGYAPDSRVLSILAGATLTQDLTVPRGGGTFESLSITPTPVSSVLVTLKSDNPAVATVPATLTYPPGTSVFGFLVTGVGAGSTTIHASAATIPDTTANVTVTGTMNLTNGTPGVGMYSPAKVNLNFAPGSPATLTITSNSAAVVLSADPNTPGSNTLTLNNVTGSSVTFYEQGHSAGTATITVTSPLYNTVSAPVTVRSPSISYQFGANMQTVSTLTTPTFYASLGQTNGFDFTPCVSLTTGVVSCGLSPGASVTVGITSGTPATGTIDTNSLTFTASTLNIPVKFTPLATGSTRIGLSAAPAGYVYASGYDFFVTSVVQPTFTLPNTAVGVAAGMTLPRAGALSIADTSANGATVTVTVGSASASLSLDPSVMGGQTLTIPNVTSALPTIYIQGLAYTPTVTTLTYSAPGYKSVTVNMGVGLGTAVFSVAPPTNIATSDVPAPVSIQLSCYNVDPTISCFLNPTTDPHFTIVSSNPAVARVDGSYTFAPMTGKASGATITGLSAGSSTISFGAMPSPLTTPSNAYGTYQFTTSVSQSKFFPQAVNTGANLYVSTSVTAGPRSDGQATTITFTSSNPAVAVLSTDATVLGSASFSYAFSTTQSKTYYIQGLSAGTSTLTLSAPGYANSTATITVLPSGVVFPPAGLAISTTSFSNPTTITLYLAELNATTGAVSAYCGFNSCALNPGAAISFGVTSSDTNIGTIVSSPLTIAPGGTTATTTFVPSDVGNVTIGITQPAGFTTGASASVTGTAKVSGDSISIADVKVGAGVYLPVSATLGSTPPKPVTMTVTLADPSLAVLSTDATVMGTGGTLTFPNLTCASYVCSSGGPPMFYVQGLAPGYTKMTVAVKGYVPTTITVAVYKVGITLYSISNPYVVDTVPTGGTSKIAGIVSLLDQYSQSLIADCTISQIACLPNPGVVPAFTLATDDPTIGVFSPTSAPYDPTTGFVFDAYTGLRNGTTNFSLATQSAGFYNTTTISRKQGQASSAAKNDATYGLVIEAHDIDAGAGVEVIGNVGLSGTTTNILSLQLHLTVADPTIAVISTSANTAGTSTLALAGLNYINGSFYVQGLKTGTTTITITGDLYQSRTITVNVRPAGFAFRQFDFVSKIGHDANIVVTPVVLNDAGQWMANAQLNPGTTATVQVSSANTAAATAVNSTITFAANATSATFQLHPVAVGTATFNLGATSSLFRQGTTYQSVGTTVQQ